MAIIYKVAHNTSTVSIIASFINDNLCYPVLGCSSIYTHKIHTTYAVYRELVYTSRTCKN